MQNTAESGIFVSSGGEQNTLAFKKNSYYH
jgi:hypothetical protein